MIVSYRAHKSATHEKTIKKIRYLKSYLISSRNFYNSGLCQSKSHFLGLYFFILSNAAPTKPRKSGCGLLGRDLNSGWNCTPT